MTTFEPDGQDRDPTSLAARDIVSGLSEVFAPTDGFRVREDFADTPPITNETQTAVLWEYAATHTGTFQGIHATDEPIVVRGVTIVDTGRGDEPLFYRYIDWADVFVQLNLSSTGRPAVEEPFGSSSS